MTTFSPSPSLRGPVPQPVGNNLNGAPSGIFAPGTKVQVGSHRVVVEKYLSEGGFAHVYVVRLPKQVEGSDTAVLKRVVVPDKTHLTSMRTEVETMKRLKGHKHIVRYIDSHASQLKGGGYEVFLLMEHCAGGGLIDFMNTRLRDRLKEPEILHIFGDVVEGVACMHYLRPPLLHRDLKVENVLIAGSGLSKTYKLCDFGSASPPRSAATSATEGRLIEEDIQQHTTLQYRCPEMIDVYRKQPIDEKSDIWALGVFLFKLCYYTTPFEDVGQMAILNASFKFPAYPIFSDKLKLLIAKMLRENPAERPNIYEVLQQSCAMRGTPVPVANIYFSRTPSKQEDSQRFETLAQPKTAIAGAMLSAPSEPKPTTVPNVAPMRRGRPEKVTSHPAIAQHSPSPLRMIDQQDPFASLDESKPKAGDELSSRFPTLDQFSLLSQDGKYDFGSSSNGSNQLKEEQLGSSGRTPKLSGNESPAKPTAAFSAKSTRTAPPVVNPSSRAAPEQKTSIETSNLSTPAGSFPSVSSLTSSMVSKGTMTLPSSPPYRERILHRFPPQPQQPQQPQQPRAEQPTSPPVNSREIKSHARFPESRFSGLPKQDAASSQSAELRIPSSSRPSLEGAKSPNLGPDALVSRSQSTNSKVRPASVNVVSKPPVQNYSLPKSSTPEDTPCVSHTEGLSRAATVASDTTITSDVEFLRAKEDEGKSWRGSKRHSGGHGHHKRSSLPSLSRSGTKNILTGRFGDAFRKFEGGAHGLHSRSRSSSPADGYRNHLTPVAGSEATDLNDERHESLETDNISAEARRENERRRLSAEERRVAEGAANYRKHIAERDGTRESGTTKAISIQNKVRSLLKENDKPELNASNDHERPDTPSATWQPQDVDTKSPLPPDRVPNTASFAKISIPPVYDGTKTDLVSQPPAKVPSHVQSVSSRPAAPPKPFRMRTGTSIATKSPTSTATAAIESDHPKLNDDWERNFSKRYPSLSGLEIPKPDVPTPSQTTLMRTKEV